MRNTVDVVRSNTCRNNVSLPFAPTALYIVHSPSKVDQHCSLTDNSSPDISSSNFEGPPPLVEPFSKCFFVFSEWTNAKMWMNDVKHGGL